MFLLCFTHSFSKYLLSTYYLLWPHHPAKLEVLDSSFYPHNQSTSHVYPTSSIPIYCPAFSPALLKLPATTHSPVILHTEWCFLFLKMFSWLLVILGYSSSKLLSISYILLLFIFLLLSPHLHSKQPKLVQYNKCLILSSNSGPFHIPLQDSPLKATGYPLP